MKEIKYLFKQAPFAMAVIIIMLVAFTVQFFHSSIDYSIGIILSAVISILWCLQAKLDLARKNKLLDKVIKQNAVIYGLAKRLKTLHNDDLITLDEENRTFKVEFEEKLDE